MKIEIINGDILVNKEKMSWERIYIMYGLEIKNALSLAILGGAKELWIEDETGQKDVDAMLIRFNEIYKNK